MIRPNFDVSAQMTNESSFTFPFHMHQKILKSEFKKKNKRSKKSRWNISDMCIYICIYMKSVRWTEPTRERNKNSQLPQKKYRRTMKMFQYDRFKLRRIKEPPHRKFLFFSFNTHFLRFWIRAFSVALTLPWCLCIYVQKKLLFIWSQLDISNAS